MHKKPTYHGQSRPKFKAQAAPRFILMHKPYHVMCQFSREDERKTLADCFLEHSSGMRVPRDVYPAGRLDYDSEGLLILTNVGRWQARISEPKYRLEKQYWAQVEGELSDDQCRQLCDGVQLNDGPAHALAAEAFEPQDLWPRVPPIRERAAIPTAWLALTLNEGRNRQVRRMTAAVGAPTLRLIRWQIGPWSLDGLAPGEWRDVAINEVESVLGRA